MNGDSTARTPIPQTSVPCPSLPCSLSASGNRRATITLSITPLTLQRDMIASPERGEANAQGAQFAPSSLDG